MIASLATLASAGGSVVPAGPTLAPAGPELPGVGRSGASDAPSMSAAGRA